MPLPAGLQWALPSSGHSGFSAPKPPLAASEDGLRKLAHQNRCDLCVAPSHISGCVLAFAGEGGQHFIFLPGRNLGGLTSGDVTHKRGPKPSRQPQGGQHRSRYRQKSFFLGVKGRGPSP